MEDSKKVVVRSTKGQIKEFQQSFLWKDIKRELGMWKRMFEKESMSVIANTMDGSENTASILTHLGDIHGRCASIDYLLSLPDIFLQTLKEEKDDSGRIEAQ